MDTVERFWSKVKKTAGCWNWIRALNAYGYGVIRINGINHMAHRYAFEAERHPIPPGLDLDHLCRNRRCVRPDHLEPVTRKENLNRGIKGAGKPRPSEKKIRCIRGHLLSETAKPSKRGRYCYACLLDCQRKRRAKLRELRS